MRIRTVANKLLELWEKSVVMHSIITLAVVVPTVVQWVMEIPVSETQYAAFWLLLGSYGVKTGQALTKGDK